MGIFGFFSKLLGRSGGFESADGETVCAAVDRIDEIIAENGALSHAQSVVYALNTMDMELNNGGLCQFFVNSSREFAPVVSEYLKEVGAMEHKRLYDDFVTENGIDTKDLSSFDIDAVSEYEAQTERYPFEEFDDAFFALDPLEGFIARYIREDPSFIKWYEGKASLRSGGGRPCKDGKVA